MPPSRLHLNLNIKLLLIGELVLLVMTLVLLFPVRGQMREQVTLDIQRELRAIAATGALYLNGDWHAQIDAPGDVNSHEFHRLRRQLFALRAVNELTADNIYTFYFDRHEPSPEAPYGESTLLLRYAVMTQDPFVGDPYRPERHHHEALRTGVAYASDLFEDKYGEWIAAAAPIRNKAGEIVGLLEVNQNASLYFARIDRLTLINTAIGLVALAITSLIGWFVLNITVIRPVQAIHRGMLALGRQDFAHRVNLETHDELQHLGETLNWLSGQLNAAKTVQSRFFPACLPQPEGFRLAGHSQACDATGGDYYDAFELPSGDLAVVIADVTGHGLGPSLLMAGCRTALRTLAGQGLPPDELLQRLNQELAEDLSGGRFITLLYGVLVVYPCILDNSDAFERLDIHAACLLSKAA